MQTWNPDYGKKTKFIHRSRARRTDAEPIIHKVNLLVVIGPFLFQYTTRACPAQWGKKKTVAGQVDFVRLLYLLWRRFWEIRAAVSLRLHKPITTCRDTVADWRLIYRVPFAFSKLTWSTSVKKALLLLRASIALHRHYRSMWFSIIMTVLGAPVSHCGNLAFFVAFFSEMTRLSAGVGLRLHSIHPWIEMEVHNEEN